MYFGPLIGGFPLWGNIQSGGNINKFPFLGIIFKLENTVSPPLSTSLRYHKNDKNLRHELESVTSTCVSNLSLPPTSYFFMRNCSYEFFSGKTLESI